MPLRNRVDPAGEIHAVADRGEFYGNRGCIHDGRGRLVRHAQVKRWLICLTEFKGRKRPLLQPGQYTELFFLDEVTGLAAGHRPCFECRREAAKAYTGRFASVHGLSDPKVDAIDAILDTERRIPHEDPSRRTSIAVLADFPDGVMVRQRDRFLALRGGRLWPWSFAGYGAPIPPGELGDAPLFRVTPASTVAVLAAGYAPAFHSRSAGA